MLRVAGKLEPRSFLPLRFLSAFVLTLCCASIEISTKVIAEGLQPSAPTEPPPPPGFKSEYLPPLPTEDIEAYGFDRPPPPPLPLPTDLYPLHPPFPAAAPSEVGPVYPSGPVYGEDEFQGGFLTTPYDYTGTFLHSLKEIQDIQNAAVRRMMLSMREVESGEQNAVGGRQEVKVGSDGINFHLLIVAVSNRFAWPTFCLRCLYSGLYLGGDGGGFRVRLSSPTGMTLRWPLCFSNSSLTPLWQSTPSAVALGLILALRSKCGGKKVHLQCKRPGRKTSPKSCEMPWKCAWLLKK